MTTKMKGSIFQCIVVCLAAVTVRSQDSRRQCPRFNSRYEEDNLIIVLSQGCEMVVGTLDIAEHSGMVPADNTGSGLMTDHRSFHIPTVTYRRPGNTWSAARSGEARDMCPPYPVRYLGPRVAIDTVPDTCQEVLGVRTFRVMVGSGRQFPGASMLRTRPVFVSPTPWV